jgi:two-component system chemotaxis response regulator CheY
MADAPSPDSGARAAYVLDDEAGVRAIILHLLKSNGFAGFEFSSPQPMLEKLASASPALIVLDFELGRSDAVEVMGQLAGLKYAGAVLLISGRDEETLGDIRRIGEQQGLTMLVPLRKPFRSKELSNRLATLGTDAQTPQNIRQPA